MPDRLSSQFGVLNLVVDSFQCRSWQMPRLVNAQGPGSQSQIWQIRPRLERTRARAQSVGSSAESSLLCNLLCELQAIVAGGLHQ